MGWFMCAFQGMVWPVEKKFLYDGLLIKIKKFYDFSWILGQPIWIGLTGFLLLLIHWYEYNELRVRQQALLLKGDLFILWKEKMSLVEY